MVYTTIITVHYTAISLFYVYTILLIINCVQSKFNIANRIRNILIQIMCMLEILSYIGIDNCILNLTYDNVQKISNKYMQSVSCNFVLPNWADISTK